MTALVLDAGAFIAVERGRRDVIRKLAAAQLNDIELRTSAIVLGQVWRKGSGQQATIARLLRGVDVAPVDRIIGLAAGLLIGRAQISDPIDAAVVLTADPGDAILTSDPGDIAHLVATAGARVA